MKKYTLGVVGSLASIIGLVLYFIPQRQPEKISNVTNADGSHGLINAQPINSPNTKIEIVYPNEKPTTEPRQPIYYVRIFNCDDGCKVFVNDKMVAKTGFGDDSGLINITENLKTGKNNIKIIVINDIGAITYGYEIIKNGETLFHETCGSVYKLGCDNNRNFQVGVARTFSHEIFKP